MEQLPTLVGGPLGDIPHREFGRFRERATPSSSRSRSTSILSASMTRWIIGSSNISARLAPICPESGESSATSGIACGSMIRHASMIGPLGQNGGYRSRGCAWSSQERQAGFRGQSAQARKARKISSSEPRHQPPLSSMPRRETTRRKRPCVAIRWNSRRCA